ncbi:hypothetical protein OBBRIDRAFT_543210 [Obba rivulosa]|uniref:Uncharacterized protein n=1 Tax=Obba rivulosa TaxID=1052685 RepID=A0A8E2AVP3_9APHY|nr:hypothetical protein OBBRIDRAFT_543210 [Obba rivulosa]
MQQPGTRVRKTQRAVKRYINVGTVRMTSKLNHISALPIQDQRQTTPWLIFCGSALFLIDNMSHSIEPITCILNVVNSTAYWTFRHIILLNIPALYGQMFSTKSDLESAEDRGSLDTWWDDLLKEYNGMAGISAATVTLSMTILQTSFCAGNSTAFTCGTTTLICGLIAFAFCAMYIWLMQQFRGVQERVNWVQVVHSAYS